MNISTFIAIAIIKHTHISVNAKVSPPVDVSDIHSRGSPPYPAEIPGNRFIISGKLTDKSNKQKVGSTAGVNDEAVRKRECVKSDNSILKKDDLNNPLGVEPPLNFIQTHSKDRDDEEDEYNGEKEDDIDKDLDEAEEREEEEEKMLEDAEDIGIKESIEEENAEEEMAKEKLNEEGEKENKTDDDSKGRIRYLMEQLVHFSLELKRVNIEINTL